MKPLINILRSLFVITVSDGLSEITNKKKVLVGQIHTTHNFLVVHQHFNLTNYVLFQNRPRSIGSYTCELLCPAVHWIPFPGTYRTVLPLCRGNSRVLSLQLKVYFEKFTGKLLQIRGIYTCTSPIPYTGDPQIWALKASALQVLHVSLLQHT